jgi:hypothetical protein
MFLFYFLSDFVSSQQNIIKTYTNIVASIIKMKRHVD